MKRNFCILLLVCGVVCKPSIASQVVLLQESPPNSERSKSVEELIAGYIKEGFCAISEEDLDKQFGVTKSAYEKFLNDPFRRVLYGSKGGKYLGYSYEYIIVKSPKQIHFFFKSS